MQMRLASLFLYILQKIVIIFLHEFLKVAHITRMAGCSSILCIFLVFDKKNGWVVFS
jgi:hypothetical protein